MTFFHAHAHSHFSTLDGMPNVRAMVQKAHKDGHPAMALTDHGLGAGWVQLYKACKEYGMKAFPGVETYLIDPEMDEWETPPKGVKVGRYHVGLLALNEDGYKALVKFLSLTHTRPRFSRFARCTLSDLFQLGMDAGDGIALTTGCYFGLVQQMLVTRGYDAALKAVKMYTSAFENVFVEVQHHNITHDDGQTDDQIVESLMQIAGELDLPVIATQDAHYLDRPEKRAHSLMKKMTYGGEDDEFPGDAFHLASKEWVKEHYTDKQWERIEEGLQELLDLNDMRITPLDSYTADIPDVKGVKNPYRHIARVCTQALVALSKKDKRVRLHYAKYQQRLQYELDIIQKLKVPGYFVIWEQFVRWCRNNHIAIEARGSANGSLACYLMGITQVDPIKWGTMFERFLSLDRIKLPDIDMDIEDAERPRAVHYMLSLYESVQIGTFGKLGSSFNEDGEETGSVMVSWKSWKRRECEAIALERYSMGKIDRKGDVPRYAQGIFKNKYGHVNEVEDVRTVSQFEYEGLRQIAQMGSVYRSYGVHAGGVLLGGKNVKIEDYIPTMLVASSDTRVSQFDMDDVEEFGLAKMDILGQATLRSMKIANALIRPTEDPTDFTWIPDDESEACRLLRSGRTNTGIFHYEGYTKSKGGRELGIKSTMDAVLGQALYMPGCMDVAPGMTISQKDLYIQRRKSPAVRRYIRYLHPAFEDALKDTYGAVVFQEQVIQIMRNLGMDIAGINIFFKVVKDSGAGAVMRNMERIAKVREQFDALCEKNGIDPDEAWRQTASFVAYGFNRAHATGYGIRAYRTAYMKAHHAPEFMTGLLQTWAGRKKENVYVGEARRIGIRILPPDVNISGPLWTLQKGRNAAIRKGLLSVSGVGEATAIPIANGAPYSSVEDMVARLPGRALPGGAKYLKEGTWTGTLGKLRDVGALDSLIRK